MTVVRCDQGPTSAAGLACLVALRGDVRDARIVLGAPAPAAAPSIDGDPGPHAIDQAWRALGTASDDLVALLADCGIETPLGRRLHDLRSRLDAHLLAADTLRNADAPQAAASVLHRTVDLVGLELEALFATPIW